MPSTRWRTAVRPLLGRPAQLQPQAAAEPIEWAPQLGYTQGPLTRPPPLAATAAAAHSLWEREHGLTHGRPDLDDAVRQVGRLNLVHRVGGDVVHLAVGLTQQLGQELGRREGGSRWEGGRGEGIAGGRVDHASAGVSDCSSRQVVRLSGKQTKEEPGDTPQLPQPPSPYCPRRAGATRGTRGTTAACSHPAPAAGWLRGRRRLQTRTGCDNVQTGRN